MWLYLPNQQQINGRQTQKNPSLNLSAYVHINVHPLSYYTEVSGGILLYLINFIFCISVQHVHKLRGYSATSWSLQLNVGKITSKYHLCICGFLAEQKCVFKNPNFGVDKLFDWVKKEKMMLSCLPANVSAPVTPLNQDQCPSFHFCSFAQVIYNLPWHSLKPSL